MSPHGPCSSCPAGECIGYMSLSSEPGADCMCGHPQAAHGHGLSLPPRGGCPSTGCFAFRTNTVSSTGPVGRTPCQNLNCGRPYMAHEELPTQSPPNPMVPARASPADQTWGTTNSTALSTNEYRANRAAHHRPFGPATGSSMPRQSHRPFSGSRPSGSGTRLNASPTRAAAPANVAAPATLATRAAPTPAPATLYILLYPAPMAGFFRSEDMEPYYRPARLFDLSTLYLPANSPAYRLVFEITDEAPQGTPFYEWLDRQLSSLMATRHLRFPESQPALSHWTIPTTPTTGTP
ncbi:hypothetical protein FB45DRAFT_26356 [Roridomyces roridus]|uniref:Uncharacterized protein n=1 Tax=Roridomyces roridus TaxID=1738132 RepID=A0AAD7CJY2_9AGAR|nr:hypothetical protein FB45DRAFT_26356 [Roridomyces roridus]